MIRTAINTRQFEERDTAAARLIPLPFDRNYQPKKAFFRIIATKHQP